MRSAQCRGSSRHRRRPQRPRCCAAYLARAGASVTLLERRPVLGGACVTESSGPATACRGRRTCCRCCGRAIAAELELARTACGSSALAVVDHAASRTGARWCWAASRATTSRRSSSSRARDAERYRDYEAWLEGSRRRSSRCSTRAPPRWSRATELARAGCARRRRLARRCGSCSARRARCSRSGSSRSRCARRWRPTRSSARSRRRRRAAPATCCSTTCMGRAGGRRGVWAYVAGGMGALSRGAARRRRARRARRSAPAPRSPRSACAAGARAAWRSRAARQLDADLGRLGRGPRAHGGARATTPAWRRASRVADYRSPGREAATSRWASCRASARGTASRFRSRARSTSGRPTSTGSSARSPTPRAGRVSELPVVELTIPRSSTRASRRRASTSRRSSRSTRRVLPGRRPALARRCATHARPRAGRDRRARARASRRSIEHLEVLAAPDLEREFGLTRREHLPRRDGPARACCWRGRARACAPTVAAARALAVRGGDTSRSAGSWARRAGTPRARCWRR